jgi:hypothetical protein
MSLGFDSLSESPISAAPAGGLSAAVTSGQGAQTVDAIGAQAFIASATAGQGSQSANIAALLQFIASAGSTQASQSAAIVGYAQQLVYGAASSGQGSQTADIAALLRFIASTVSGQGSQTADALGTAGNAVIGICTSGQGTQTADCTGASAGGTVYLDGAGVGRGNKSWWHDKEMVVDHRIRHKASVKTRQSQGAECIGGVVNPFTLLAFTGKQSAQSMSAVGDVTDPELEEYYWKTFVKGTAVAQNAGLPGSLSYITQIAAANGNGVMVQFPRKMRSTAPTIVTYNPQATNANWRRTSAADSGAPSIFNISDGGCYVYNPQVAGDTLGASLVIHMTANARLGGS